VLVTLCLFMESRRYRYFDLWNYRIRLIETNFYGSILAGIRQPMPDWEMRLAQNLMQPTFPMSKLEAIGHRLRRNYLWIFLVLQLAWVAKLLLMSGDLLTPGELLRRATMGVVPGSAVVMMVLLFDVVVLGIAILTRKRNQVSPEVTPQQKLEDHETKAKSAS
jgi:uncharacterized membrane protein